MIARLLLCMAALVAPGAALAGFSYDYASVSYFQTEPDDAPAAIDIDGFEGTFDKSLGRQFFFDASAKRATISAGGDQESQGDYRGGLGAHVALGKSADLVGKVNYAVFVPEEGDSEDGMAFSVGVRGRPAKFLQLEGFFNRVHVVGEDLDSQDVTAIFRVLPPLLWLTVSYHRYQGLIRPVIVDADGDGWSLGLRVPF